MINLPGLKEEGKAFTHLKLAIIHYHVKQYKMVKYQIKYFYTSGFNQGVTFKDPLFVFKNVVHRKV